MTQPPSEGQPPPTRQTRGNAPSPADPGEQRVGPYTLLRLLGEGAVGQVWLARDRVLDRDVALKLLRPDLAATATTTAGDGRLSDFLKEARAAAKLNHPNIVTVYQVGRDGAGSAGRVFIAMEFVQRGSLADELKTHGALPWRQATQAVRDATAALAEAHAAGIVHRDVKPANLMCSARGVVKVADFGLARSDAADPELTQTRPGMLLGSPAYMSPEQCRGQRADARSDLYALACTYYQLLTRQLPFAGADVASVMYQHCHEPFPDAAALAPGLPDGVRRILARGSAKGPADRHPSAEALLADLDAVLHTPEASHTFDGGHPTKAIPPAARRPFLRDVIVPILKGKGVMGKLVYSLALATVVAALLLLTPRRGGPSTPAPDDRVAAATTQPVPPQAAQYKAEQTVKNLFKSEYADRSPDARRALARKLLAQGASDGLDAATRYVCFREAKDLAAAAGDTATAFEAIDALVRAYPATDATELKAAAFATAAPLVTTPDGNVALTQTGFELLDQLVAAERYPSANGLLATLDAAAAKTKQLPLVTKVQAKRAEVAELQRDANKLRQARETLKRDPNNADANLTVGRFLAFTKGDWDAALPLLAKGSDAGLKELAGKELAKPGDSKGQLAVADGWWTAGEKLDGGKQARAREHVAALYEGMWSTLSPGERASIQGRLPASAVARLNGTASGPTSKANQPAGGTVGLPSTVPSSDTGLVRVIPTDGVPEWLAFGAHQVVARIIDDPAKADHVFVWDLRSGPVQKFGASGSRCGVTPDGLRVYSNGEHAGRMVVRDLKAGSPISETTEPGDLVDPTFTDDGRLVALRVNGTTRLIICDAKTLQTVRRIEVSPVPARIKISPDGRVIAGAVYVQSPGAPPGTKAMVLYLFSSESGKELWHADAWAPGGGLPRITFSPEGSKVVAFPLGASEAVVFNAADGHELARLGARGPMAFLPNGGELLMGIGAGSSKTGILTWNAERKNEAPRFSEPTGLVGALSISPDGRRALAGGNDGAVRLFDIATGNQIQRFEGHTGRVQLVAFSLDGRLGASGSEDKTIRVWRLPDPGAPPAATNPPGGPAATIADAPTGLLSHKVIPTDGAARSIAFGHDARELVAHVVDSTTRPTKDESYVWDLATGSRQQYHAGSGRFGVTPDGRLLVTSEDRALTMREVTTGKLVAQAKSGLSDLVFSSDGHRIVGRDRTTPKSIVVLDASTLRELFRFQPSTFPDGDPTLSPDGRYVVGRTFGAAGNAAPNLPQSMVTYLWNTESGKESWHTKPEPCDASWGDATFSPDGSKLLVTASGKGGASILDSADGHEIARLPAVGRRLARFLPDGRHLLMGLNRGASRPGLSLWETQHWEEVERFSEATDEVLSLDISPDGTRALVGCVNSSVRLFDIPSGKQIVQFSGHSDRVICVALSPDGRLAASGSNDHTIRLWRIP